MTGCCFRACPVVVTALLLLILSVCGVDSHAAFSRSEPAAGAILTESPAEIRLWFTEPLEESYTGAELLDDAGRVVPGVSFSVARDDAHQLVVLPPALPNGGYTVAWRTLSAADGHTLQGYFGFSLGTAAVGSTVPVETAPAGLESVRALTRALALLGLAALLAIAPVTLGVFGPVAQAVPGFTGAMRLPLRRFGLVAATLALLGNVAALGAQAAAAYPGVFLPRAMAQTLSDPRYGQLWLLRLALMLVCIGSVALAFWGRARWARPALIAGVILALALPVPFSLLSHAAAQQEGRLTAITADTLHLLSASVWAGGLFMLVLVLLPAMRALDVEQRRPVVRAALPRFSVIALAAWGVLALSGLYAAWLQVGTTAALWETPYGQSLLIKGALLVLIIVLAVYHFNLGRTGIGRRGGNRFPGTITVEALLAVAVLLVVGRLIGLEPAREAIANRTPPELVVPLTFPANDGERNARLAISPGAAGINSFTVEVDGEPLPAGSVGVLRFEPVDQRIGVQELALPAIGPNRFQATGTELTLPGNWRIEAIVRAIGAFSWATETVVPIDDTPPPVPQENPAPRFASVGIVGMVALAVAGLAAVTASPGALMWRSRGAALAALTAGAIVLAGARIPMSEPAPQFVAQPAPVPIASPDVVAHDNDMAAHQHHGTPVMSRATPESLPGPGDPVSGEGVRVMISTAPQSAGPVTVAIEITNASGDPLSDARVVVVSDMPDMAMGRMETPAVEVEPGHYLAEFVPLGMPGKWRLAVRVSPRGASTQVFSFAVQVP